MPVAVAYARIIDEHTAAVSYLPTAFCKISAASLEVMSLLLSMSRAMRTGVS